MSKLTSEFLSKFKVTWHKNYDCMTDVKNPAKES